MEYDLPRDRIRAAGSYYHETVLVDGQMVVAARASRACNWGKMVMSCR